MTREEAINEIKSWAIPSKNGREVLETLIPELRESKDERTRKKLMNEICCLRASEPKGSDRYESLTEMLSYLEKQKEQKPADYPYLPGWRKNRDDNKPELKRSVLMLTTHGVAEGEWLGKKWCQYRWSFELKDDEVLYWMHLSDLVRLEKEDEQKEQKEPNPVEWSEEDNATIKSAVHWLEKYLSTIRAKDVSSATQDDILTVKTTITNLKSLHSSWKPSEEQLEALLNILHPDDPYYYELKSLYEQLKKL